MVLLENRQVKRVIVFVLVCAMAVVFLPQAAFAQPTTDGVQQEVNDAVESAAGNYFDYYTLHADKARPQSEIVVDALTAAQGDMTVQVVDGVEAIVLDGADKWVEWIVDVEESGNYCITPEYYPIAGMGQDIQVAVLVDGQVPYTEFSAVSLPRLWKDAVKDGKTITQDSAGNDCRPEQVEAPRWYATSFKDSLGLYAEPYMVYLEQGQHTIRFSVVRECLALKAIRLGNEKQAPTYAEYISQYSESDYAKTDAVYRLEAETTAEKNSSTLYPSYDQSNSATLPNQPGFIRINTIGGSNWSDPGDAISWRADVPQAGLYQITFRARQVYNEGLHAYRSLYVNGEMPFREAETIEFPYMQNWYLKTLGADEPCYLYLKPGDILTLECEPSVMSEPLREIQRAVLDLNDVYRSIIMITGTTPDMYQDYMLEDKIPGLVDSLFDMSNRLQTIADGLIAVLGKSCAEAATIQKTMRIINELADDPFFIPDRLSAFKGGIESLSALMLTLGKQPLELDCIYFVAHGQTVPAANNGFVADFVYGTKRFVRSFLNDYSQIGNGDAKAITVWATVGRDQAQILSRLIDESFTAKTQIPVTLNLVSNSATLIKAVLADKGPDVSLSIQQNMPVNLAARGALVDLNEYDLSQLKQELYPSSWAPFEYNGGLYALPESQTCDAMFYRTDIFESLGLTPPQTWDQFYKVLKVLQSNNLQVAWPEVNAALNSQGNSSAIGIFSKFLFQNGGTYYTDDLKKTAFDTEEAYVAFEQTVELYRVFGLSRDINFFNRFRSGEAPLGIADYTAFTQLMSSAPELRGLWDFCMVPGTVKADGSVSRAQSATVTGCVMLEEAKTRGVDAQAFAFMSWWVGAEAQTRYGQEMEGILGIIGRITPANRETVKKLGWTQDELDVIDNQLLETINPPQVLGNYVIERSLTSAIRNSINDKNTPRRALSIYNKKINDEIARKRKEFNLD